MADTINFKCPNCLAPMSFDPETGKFICAYCEGVFSKEELENRKNTAEDARADELNEAESVNDKEADSALSDEDRANISDQNLAAAGAAALGAMAAAGKDKGNNTEKSESKIKAEKNFGKNVLTKEEIIKRIRESSGHKEKAQNMPEMQLFTCPSCGAEIIADSLNATSFCAYCGNNAILSSRLEGKYQPDYILPFSVSKEEAVKIYNDAAKENKFIPSVFIKNSTIEKLSGVYVPVWLYDADIDVEYQGKAEKTYTETYDDYKKHYTDYYEIRRAGNINFEKLPVDASEKMDDVIMERLEPFPHSETVPFSMEYLSGFLADHYDEDAADRAELALDRMKNATEARIDGDIDSQYSNCTTDFLNINPTEIKYWNSFLPVWLLSVKFAGKIHQFAINGRTGKLVGTYPISKLKILRSFLLRGLLRAGIIFAIFYIASNLFDLF